MLTLVADAADREVLRKARADRASRLIATCSDDGTNAEIGAQALKLNPAPSPSLQCWIQ